MLDVQWLVVEANKLNQSRFVKLQCHCRLLLLQRHWHKCVCVGRVLWVLQSSLTVCSWSKCRSYTLTLLQGLGKAGSGGSELTPLKFGAEVGNCTWWFCRPPVVVENRCIVLRDKNCWFLTLTLPPPLKNGSEHCYCKTPQVRLVFNCQMNMYEYISSSSSYALPIRRRKLAHIFGIAPGPTLRVNDDALHRLPHGNHKMSVTKLLIPIIMLLLPWLTITNTVQSC